ncbi:Dephospho-CoA kinase domain-containing protein [Lemmus lemmus]
MVSACGGTCAEQPGMQKEEEKEQNSSTPSHGDLQRSHFRLLGHAFYKDLHLPVRLELAPSACGTLDSVPGPDCSPHTNGHAEAFTGYRDVLLYIPCLFETKTVLKYMSHTAAMSYNRDIQLAVADEQAEP